MKKLLTLTIPALFLFLQTAKGQSSGSDRPNIIFILIDDQRYDFLSFLDHPWIQTPHIDRLAENSLYLNNAFVTTSLCSPSRASIVTGMYAHSHQVIDNETPLSRDLPMFPVELQRAGYKTAFMGKWHMGGRDASPRPGFDHWISFKGQGPYTDPVFNIDGAEVAREGYTPDLLTEYAVDYIHEASGGDEPYFLYLSHKSIHEPFTPAARHENAYDGFKTPKPDTYEPDESKPAWLKAQKRSWHGAERDFGIQDYGSLDHFFELYSECMLAVDEGVGEITKALEAAGQLEETVIIYYSDNGYLMGEHGLIDKRVMYEESIRVPAFVHWPEAIRAGRIDDSFILNIDLGPTILDLAGVRIPEAMHGMSFAPIIRNESVDWRSSFLYEYFIDPNAVQTPTIFGLRTQNYSYMTYHGVWDVYELYDMQEDPEQRINLLGEVKYGIGYGTFLRHVNQQLPQLAPTVAQLEMELDAILQETGGSRTPKWQND